MTPTNPTPTPSQEAMDDFSELLGHFLLKHDTNRRNPCEENTAVETKALACVFAYVRTLRATITALEAALRGCRDPRPSMKWQADIIDAALAATSRDGGTTNE